MSRSSVRVLEFWTVSSIVIFALSGAALALVGYRVFVQSRAQMSVEECKSYCTNNDPMCLSGCESMNSSSGGMGSTTGGMYGGGMDNRCMEIRKTTMAGEIIGYQYCPMNGGCTIYGAAGNVVCTTSISGAGGGGVSAMKNCTYPNATRSGAPVGTIWCEGDYYNCHFDSPTGTVVTFDNLSLGAPSSCEEGWSSGGSATTGAGGESCTPMRLDPSFTMGADVACPSFVNIGGGDDGGGTSGGGGQRDGEDGSREKVIILDKGEAKLQAIVKNLPNWDFGDAEPCMPKEIRPETFKDHMEYYKDALEEWFRQMEIRHDITRAEFNALETCPDIEQTVAQSEMCDEIEHKAFMRAKNILDLPDLTEEDREEKFRAVVEEYIGSKAKEQGITCVYSGRKPEKEHEGTMCKDDGECPKGYICNLWDQNIAGGERRSSLKAALLSEQGYGWCQRIPDGACLRDEHCDGGACPIVRVCAKAPCWQECPHAAAVDCDDLTLARVKEWLPEGTPPGTVIDIYEKKKEQCGEGESEEGDEGDESAERPFAGADGDEGDEGDESDEGQREHGQKKLGKVFGDVVKFLMDVVLTAGDKLGDDVRSVLQDAVQWFGQAIMRIAIHGGEVDVGKEVSEAVSWVERIREMLPEDVVIGEEDEEERGYRRSIVTSRIINTLNQAEGMLSEWIPAMLAALADEGYSDPKWKEHLDRARAEFEEAREECGMFLSGLEGGRSEGAAGPGDCFESIEEVFSYLDREMRPSVEGKVPSEVMMRLMGEIGPPPIEPLPGEKEWEEDWEWDEEDHDDYDDKEDWCADKCENEVGVSHLLDKSDQECVARVAPLCLEDESAVRCGDVFEKCDAKYLTAAQRDALGQCINRCMGFGEEGGDRGHDEEGDRGRHDRDAGADLSRFEDYVTVKILVDGGDDVVIRGNTMSIHHRSAVLPGYWKGHTEIYPPGKGEPVTVTYKGREEKWQPQWGEVDPRNCDGCESKDSYELPFSLEGKALAFAPIAFRDQAYVEDYPEQYNGYTARIRLGDGPFAGAYRITFAVGHFGDAAGGDGDRVGGDGRDWGECRHILYGAGGDRVGEAKCTRSGCDFFDSGGNPAGFCTENGGCLGGTRENPGERNEDLMSRQAGNVMFGPCNGAGSRPGTGGGDSTSTMYRCTYDGVRVVKTFATFTAGMTIRAFCERDYENCRVLQTTAVAGGEPPIPAPVRDYASLGPPSYCESGWDGGGGGGGGRTGGACKFDWVVLRSDRDNPETTRKTRNVVCERRSEGGWCHVPTENPLMDPLNFPESNVFEYGPLLNPRECPAPGGTGGTGESGCFYINVKKDGRYIGFSVHCTQEGTNCRSETANGKLIDMMGVILGTERNCYGPGGDGGGGGGGGGGGTMVSCVFPAYRINSDGTIGAKLAENVREDMSSMPSGSSYGGYGGSMGPDLIGADTGTRYPAGTVERDHVTCDCPRWENGQQKSPDGVFDDCNMGGGGMGGGGMDMACVNRGVTNRKTGQVLSEDVLCGGAVSYCEGLTSKKRYAMSALDMMSSTCDCPRWESGAQKPRDGVFDDCGGYGGGGGGTSGGGETGTYGSSPGAGWRLIEWQKSGGTEKTWVGPGVTDAEIAAAKDAIARNCPAATWFSYPNPTDASRPGAGVPSCPAGTGGTTGGTTPGGGGSSTGMRNCFYPNATRSGTPVGTIWCEGDYYNCHFDSPTGTVVTFDNLSLGGPSSCEEGWSGGGAGCTAYTFLWVIFTDGTRYDGIVTCATGQNYGCTKDSGETIDPARVSSWGPSTCKTASRGGLLNIVGNFFRMLFVGR